jgi:hypothetical protein
VTSPFPLFYCSSAFSIRRSPIWNIPLHLAFYNILIDRCYRCIAKAECRRMFQIGNRRAGIAEVGYFSVIVMN